MKYQAILARFYSEPWALQLEKYEAIRRFLLTKAAGDDVSPEEIQAVVAARRSGGVQVTGGGVAVLPVFGVLSQRVGMLEEASGGQSTERIGATLDGLIADKDVAKILMVFDSPGGSVHGVDELATKIRSARSRKPVAGIADSVAASAGYWLLAQTSPVFITPGGQVGSIGVIAGHQDWSEHDRRVGVKTTWVTSSPHKAEFASENPLSPEAHAELQSKIDHYHRLFVQDVARGRNVSEVTVNAEFGRGRMMTPGDALRVRAVDQVATLPQALAQLASGGGKGGPLASLPTSDAPLSARLAAIRARAVEVSESN